MKEWIEAMRLRTLPVSVAGVITGTACAVYHHGFSVFPAIICLVFAVLAQIASNFANEYYDFKNGLDKKGREGFRRGVTEGDISPAAMKKATFATLMLAACVGCSLIIWGGWWLIFIGIAIGIFALAYSTGPFPLSHNGLGEVTVFIFFGILCQLDWKNAFSQNSTLNSMHIQFLYCSKAHLYNLIVFVHERICGKAKLNRFDFML